MSENGTFRTSLRGFNKMDVLRYIDDVNARHATELEEARRETQAARDELAGQAQQLAEGRTAVEQNAELNERCAALEKELAAAREQSQKADGLAADNAQLRDQLQGMRRLADDAAAAQRAAEQARTVREKEAGELRIRLEEQATQLETQAAQLAEQATLIEQEARRREGENREAVSLREENDRLKAAAAEQETELRRLQEANRRYDELVGDVGAFIMEIRAMGQRYLSTSYSRAEQSLDAAEDALSVLHSGLETARGELETARSELEDNSEAAGLRLEEWERELERSGLKAVPEEKPQEPPEEAPEGQPSPAQDPPQAKPPADFFR